MTKKFKLILAAALTAIALPAFAADPDATISLSGGRVGLGIGYSWADGVLHYQGQDYPLKIEGLSGGDVGLSKFSAVGEVYNLGSLADFAGKYDVLSGGATLIGGTTGSMEENNHGVKLHLRSKNTGLDLNFAIEGMKIRFAKPIDG